MWTDELIKMQQSGGEDMFFTVRSYETVDSTNEEVKRLALKGAEEGLVCISLEQTAGKGRLGRRWSSPKGEAVYMSLLLRPDIPSERASMLTLVMGLSAAQGISGYTSLPAGIKWPNDIVVSGKKICGILTEAAVTAGTRPDYVVIGIGINVNNESFPDELAERATSIRMETGRTFSLSETAEAVLAHFKENYGIFLRTADLSGLIEPYEQLLCGKNSVVRIEDPRGAYTAAMQGIDAEGALLVTHDGFKERISSGEVSVRGLYGYV